MVELTRHLMERDNLNNEDAYRRLLSMELYELLQDTETGLYLETNDYLDHACDAEITGGVDELYLFINESTRL